MRIIQITDQHVGAVGEQPYGVDVRNNLLRLCRHIKKLQPDHLVITGDLCLEDGNAEVYRWFRNHIGELAIPYEVLSGNHDNPCLLAKTFEVTEDLKGEELYYHRIWNEEQFLFLDTSPGTLSREQLEWTEEKLTGGAYRCRNIFMHHPPVEAGVPHMDKNHPLEAPFREALARIFAKAAEPVHVFCGHYHHARTILVPYGTVFISPSSYVQINPYVQRFEPEHTAPGFRLIDLDGDQLRTSVHFIVV